MPSERTKSRARRNTGTNTGGRDYERLTPKRFPRSSTYHPEWVMASASGGANALWLTEWLAEAMDLRPHMRVLDLGCGLAASSIRGRGRGLDEALSRGGNAVTRRSIVLGALASAVAAASGQVTARQQRRWPRCSPVRASSRCVSTSGTRPRS